SRLAGSAGSDSRCHAARRTALLRVARCFRCPDPARSAAPLEHLRRGVGAPRGIRGAERSKRHGGEHGCTFAAYGIYLWQGLSQDLSPIPLLRSPARFRIPAEREMVGTAE